MEAGAPIIDAAGPRSARALKLIILTVALLMLVVVSVNLAVSAEGEPGAPTDLTATMDSVLVFLAWEAPEDEGTSAILEYNILRGDTIDNLTMFTKIGGTTFTDSTAPGDTTLFYGVSARNAAGNGLLSNVVSVDVPGVTVPSAPRSVTVSEKDGVVTLAWGTPLTNGGSPITGYTVMRGTTSGGETQLTTLGVVLEYEDNDVEEGKTYFYQVRAVNDIGSGRVSNEVSVTVPEEEEEDDTPTLALYAVIVVIIIIIILFAFRAGKKGGPEQMAPIGKEPDTAKAPPTMMAEEAKDGN
jgi:fibronectin type 3 domain-containing protein